MVLHDAPQQGEPRSGGPLPFVDGHTHEGRRDFVTKVRLSTQVRAGDYACATSIFACAPTTS